MNLKFITKLAEGGSGEIQIMRTGKWNHPQYGLFEITKEKIANYIKNFEANVRGLVDENGNPQIDTDYDHKKRTDKASGWIKGLSVKNEGNELWAKVEPTSDAKVAIKNGEYKYFSPEFTDEYTDPETNRTFKDVLLGGALTNRPFIKGMSAVSLSESQSAGCDIYLLTDGEGEQDPENNQRKDGVSTMDAIKELAELKGTHAGTVKELTEAKTTIAKQEKDIADNKKKLDEAQATIKEMKDAKEKEIADAKEKEVKSLMEIAIKEGKVKPADTKEIDGKKGFLLKLAETDIESAKETVSRLPKILDDEAKGDSGAGMDDDASKTGKKELSEADFDAKATKLADESYDGDYESAVKSMEAQGFKVKA